MIDDLAKIMRCEKARRRPRYAEDRLQMACRRWFDMQYPAFSLLLHHSPNEGKLWKSERDGAKRKAMGVRAGFPDFVLLQPSRNYPYLCVELKSPKGRQSESQKAYQRAVETAGGRYVVVRTLEEFIGTIREYMTELY